MREAVRKAWMVVECIPEIKEAKIELLGQLDGMCEDDTIIATISSSYKSGDLLGKPPELPPVEIMSSGFTDPAIIDVLVVKLKEIGLDPVVAKKQSTGLVYNRVWAAMKREVMMVLADDVGTPEDIDKLFRYSFRSVGAPCALMDDVGLQTVCNIEDHYVEERDHIPKYPVDYIRRNYVDKGYLGTMVGRGLYDHTQSSKTRSNEQKPSLRSQLIGSWELVDYSAHKEHDSRGKVYPMGETAQGMIMYTPDGYMSAQLQRPGQPKFQNDDLNGGTKEEWQAAGENYFAYAGPYYLDESGEEPLLQHHMTNCSFPNWLGNTQRRLVSITEEGSEKHLTLGPESATVIMGELRITQLRWRRLKENHDSTPAP